MDYNEYEQDHNFYEDRDNWEETYEEEDEERDGWDYARCEDDDEENLYGQDELQERDDDVPADTMTPDYELNEQDDGADVGHNGWNRPLFEEDKEEEYKVIELNRWIELNGGPDNGVDNWLIRYIDNDVSTYDVKKSFNSLTLFSLVCYCFKSNIHRQVIKKKFAKRFPETVIVLSFEQDSQYFIIEAQKQRCKIGIKQVDGYYFVTLEADDRYGKFVNNRRRWPLILDFFEMFLDITGAVKLKYQRKRSEMLTLHDLAAINLFSQIIYLTLEIDNLNQDETQYLLHGFPHPRRELKISFMQPPSFDRPLDGAIKTNQFICLNSCNFVTLSFLRNSKIRNVELYGVFDHFELNFLLYSWTCGDFGWLQSFKCGELKSFDFEIMMSQVETTDNEEVKKLFGLFQKVNHEQLSRQGWDLFGDSAVHISRDDGKCMTIFLDKGDNLGATVSMVIWS